ncbi:hypothetical protein [Amycolatopsis anabasis]|uniref:hypothetical protein n=1 Tax=Amycolatopsis anabasis TaxID=1840409 RepID=UPI00131D19FB|nr:hypothetical protein [Amycolatopsis anabasis]
MTATEVDGVAVVADTPHVAPFTDRSGQPVYQPQTRVLTLADGSTVYGCAHCDYTSENPRSIRPHLGKHNRRRNGLRPAKDAVLDMPLTDLMDRLAKLDAILEEREQWKARALQAERRLRQLRDALGMRA